MAICGDCGGTVIEYDVSAGNGFCVKCGTVVEENTIVSEVTFGETSSGAAMVQGSYVGQGSTRARVGGPFGNRGSIESREQTIANATKKIRNVASVLRLSEVVILAATRMYTLAVEHKFTRGRKSLNVVAVCLYVACRQKETRNYMLIDFSDLLQVNVFELGHAYLQLVQTLNLRLPLVDPSHYISRFAALLEFGDETPKVATDAVRLVQRFDRDWMTKGRRPAGICGAALLLAARMNNFRRSVEEIVQVVKIADTTLKKRLDEFKRTPSGALTLADFRTMWLEDEIDPPAFTKGKEKERALEEAEADDEGTGKKKKTTKLKGKGKGKKRKRPRNEEEEEEEEEPIAGDEIEDRAAAIPIDPALLNDGILAGTTLGLPPEDASNGPPPNNIDPALLSISGSSSHWPPHSETQPFTTVSAPPDAVEATVDAALIDEVSTFLSNTQGTSLVEALDEADERRQAQFSVVDELLGLDEEELDRFLLSEEEVKIKERIWVEMNRDYLEALAARGEPKENETAAKSRKRRKTGMNNKPRDSSTPHGSTVAESVRNLIKKNPKYSKRINYDALKDLFVEPARAGFGDGEVRLDEKDDDGETVLFRMDDKSDGESTGVGMGGVVVEEDGGGVGMASPRERREGGPDTGAVSDGGMHEEAEEGSDKGEDFAPNWEDAYEQEV